MRGVPLGLNPLPRLDSQFQGAYVRKNPGQLGPIARQSENENAPCSGLCGLMRGESQGMQCYARADVRRSGKPGVPVGLHEKTIRIPSLKGDTTLHSDCMTLTTRYLRYITPSASGRPASVETEHGANLPHNPASMGLSGHNDM